MSLSGKFDLEQGTFDLWAYNETVAVVSVTECHITLSYQDEDGQIIQLRKEHNINPLSINVGSKLITSSVADSDGAGYLEKTNGHVGQNVIAKSLAHVDFGNASTMTNYNTRTFTDSNSVVHTAVLLPVTLK